MDFEETVRAVERLLGQSVTVTVWGVDVERGGMLATLTGTLSRVRAFDPEEFAGRVPPETLEALRTAVPSESFTVDSHLAQNQVTLWPDGFVRGELLDRPDGVQFVTRDGVIWVQRYRPWID